MASVACDRFARDITSLFEVFVCEDQDGWVSSHFLLPFTFHLFIGNIWISLLIPGVVEIAETIMFILYDLNEGEVLEETALGQLVGDWFIQGFAGVFAAVLFVQVTGVPRLVPVYGTVMRGDVDEDSIDSKYAIHGKHHEHEQGLMGDSGRGSHVQKHVPPPLPPPPPPSSLPPYPWKDPSHPTSGQLVGGGGGNAHVRVRKRLGLEGKAEGMPTIEEGVPGGHGLVCDEDVWPIETHTRSATWNGIPSWCGWLCFSCTCCRVCCFCFGGRRPRHYGNSRVSPKRGCSEWSSRIFCTRNELFDRSLLLLLWVAAWMLLILGGDNFPIGFLFSAILRVCILLPLTIFTQSHWDARGSSNGRDPMSRVGVVLLWGFGEVLLTLSALPSTPWNAWYRAWIAEGIFTLTIIVVGVRNACASVV